MKTMSLLDFIPVGRNNALQGRKIAELSGINIKQIQAKISALRASGHPICAPDTVKPLGYFIPESAKEADEFYRATIARARKTWITVANVTKAVNKRFGIKLQEEISFS